MGKQEQLLTNLENGKALHSTTSRLSLLLPEAEAEVKMTKISYECKWGLTGFYPSMVLYIALVYNSGNQNVLINDLYVRLYKLNKQLYM